MNTDQMIKKAVLHHIAVEVFCEDGECTHPSHNHGLNKLPLTEQKELLDKWLEQSKAYVNPFEIGESVLSNPDKKKYKWPNKNIPGIVIEKYTGINVWTGTKNTDKLAFEDTLIAIVDEDDGEVMFYKVDSHFLVKA
jgi:hypothetical protein